MSWLEPFHVHTFTYSCMQGVWSSGQLTSLFSPFYSPYSPYFCTVSDNAEGGYAIIAVHTPEVHLSLCIRGAGNSSVTGNVVDLPQKELWETPECNVQALSLLLSSSFLLFEALWFSVRILKTGLPDNFCSVACSHPHSVSSLEYSGP